MAFLLRTIRKPKWNKNADGSNLSDEQIEAALEDLYEPNNEISVWLIYSDRSNLDRVPAAVAAKRQHLHNLDFALIDLALLDQFGIRWEHTPENADVPDPIVCQWHHDLTGATAEQLKSLIRAVVHDGSVDRRLPRAVKDLISTGIRNGNLARVEVSLTPENLAIIDSLIAQYPCVQ